MKSTDQIRTAFLDFFARNGHAVLPSSSLVPQGDPTLMFSNAGMNQFKNVFTGLEKPPAPRAATSQKCVRAGGKHNDLDNVGYTARHHTFFEMLGNFSFGDYFKEQAIDLAWELLTRDFGIPAEKLCVTVYHDDDAAWNHWKKLTGFADHKIIRIPTADNFWSMGDTGPCGPCSEIFYDHGEHIAGGPPGSPEQDGDRFVEIWNLVFMQFDQQPDGTRLALPKPSIDTGMGLERLSAVLQGVTDNYDIDLFRKLIADIKRETGNAARETGAAEKVIADHLRSMCFLIADGVLPSNEGRGYVLRRIMRRAMRYAHQLGCREPLMYRLVPSLVREMGGAYPELSRAQAAMTETLRDEEERFKQMLDRGLKLLGDESANIPQGGILSGEIAFRLYDTYGFPLDLTQDILRGRGVTVDVEGFDRSMEGQRERARGAWSGSGETKTGSLWFTLKEKLGATEFVGYEQEKADAKVLALVKDGESVDSATDGKVFVILDKTPFYGESGGQAGDSGWLCFSDHQPPESPHAIEVCATQKPLEDFYVHTVDLRRYATGKIQMIKIGDKLRAEINTDRRNAIRANHSATHLLHKALREVLGEHVTQKGSLVEADYLRFDFSHGKAMSAEEISEVERRVNAAVARNTPVDIRVMAPDDAIKAGAMALFGEKYGECVRVLTIGCTEGGEAYSVELCGGTHVRSTGDIGAFKVTREGSVASGIRRIEAVTGEGMRDYFRAQLTALQQQIAQMQGEGASLRRELGREAGNIAAPDYPQETLESAALQDLHAIYERASTAQSALLRQLQEENRALGKEIAEARKQSALSGGAPLVEEEIGGLRFASRIFDALEPKELRSVAEDMLKNGGAQVAAAATGADGKASIVVAVSPDVSARKSAVELVQAAVSALGGKGGGGRPEMAQGGGPDADKLSDALNVIRRKISE